MQNMKPLIDLPEQPGLYAVKVLDDKHNDERFMKFDGSKWVNLEGTLRSTPGLHNYFYDPVLKTHTRMDIHASENNFEKVQYFLDKKPSQDELDFSLYKAYFMENFKMAEFLIKHGADFNSKGTYDIFERACGNANLNIINHLLDKNIQGSPHFSAECLVTACRKNKSEVVDILLDKKVDVQFKNNAALLACAKNIDMVKKLIEAGADVTYGFMIGVSSKNHDFAEKMLKKGADVHYKNDKAIKVANLESDNKMIKLLVSFGADSTVASESPYSEQDFKKMKQILKNGAELLKDKDNFESPGFPKVANFKFEKFMQMVMTTNITKLNINKPKLF